jgi:hypothetical protein
LQTAQPLRRNAAGMGFYSGGRKLKDNQMKSHITMEQKLCGVCGKGHDTGILLLDRQLRQRFESHTLTLGWSMCPECQEHYDSGYVALVGVDETKSGKTPNGNIKPEEAYRTGEVVYLKFEAFDRVMAVSGFNPHGKRYPMMFCDPEVIKVIVERSQK